MPPIKAAATSSKKNIFLSVKSSQKPVITPAILPPNEMDKNQPPIISAVNRGGDNFETKDKPIGLKNISLMVNTKYVPHNHNGDVLCVYTDGTDITANTITNADKPDINMAIPNLEAVVGSLPFFLK